MNKKKQKHTDYQEWLMGELKDPKLALAYLNEALKDKDERVFLMAMKDVLEARGDDFSAIAEQADLNRQNLYKMLSKTGNPRWNSLTSVLKVLDLEVNLSYRHR